MYCGLFWLLENFHCDYCFHWILNVGCRLSKQNEYLCKFVKLNACLFFLLLMYSRINADCRFDYIRFWHIHLLSCITAIFHCLVVSLLQSAEEYLLWARSVTWLSTKMSCFYSALFLPSVFRFHGLHYFCVSIMLPNLPLIVTFGNQYGYCSGLWTGHEFVSAFIFVSLCGCA